MTWLVRLIIAIADLLGEDFVEVAARLDNRETPVDILGSIMTRTTSGVLVTMSGCGEAIEVSSDIRIFCSRAIIRTDVWGKFLELQRSGEETLTPVDTPPLSRPVGSVPQSPPRRDVKPLPAGGGPAHGSTLGRHQEVRCQQRRAAAGRRVALRRKSEQSVVQRKC